MYYLFSYRQPHPISYKQTTPQYAVTTPSLYTLLYTHPFPLHSAIHSPHPSTLCYTLTPSLDTLLYTHPVLLLSQYFTGTFNFFTLIQTSLYSCDVTATLMFSCCPGNNRSSKLKINMAVGRISTFRHPSGVCSSNSCRSVCLSYSKPADIQVIPFVISTEFQSTVLYSHHHSQCPNLGSHKGMSRRMQAFCVKEQQCSEETQRDQSVLKPTVCC
jgi:hypothetical protein